MSESIAVKLGEAFGLHDGTYRDVIEAEASSNRGDESPSDARLTDILLDALNAIMSNDDSESLEVDVALARFSSLYLPTFIEAWFLASQGDLRCTHVVVARDITYTPEFVHYVKTHPEFVSRAVEIFLPGFPSLSHLVDGSTGPEDTPEEAGYPLQNWALILQGAILVLSSSSSSAVWPPDMAPSLLLSFKNRTCQLYADLSRFIKTTNFSQLSPQRQEHLQRGPFHAAPIRNPLRRSLVSV